MMHAPDDMDENSEMTEGAESAIGLIRYIRRHIQAARTEDDDNHEHVRRALGGVRELALSHGLHSVELEDDLASIFVAPSEEKPFFLNQAEKMLDGLSETSRSECGGGDENSEESAGGPRDDVEVSVPMTAATRDLIALETDEGESIEEWIMDAVSRRLTEADVEHLHDVEADVVVEVTPEVAERARLRYEHARAHGAEVEIDDYLLDYVACKTTFTVDGEPIVDDPEEFDGAGDE